MTPYGESKVLAERAHRAARRRRLQPDLPAQRHGVRLVAAAARRHRRQQPDRHGLHPRRGPAAERRSARGGRWCTPRTSRGPSSPSLEARPRGRARPGLQRRPRRGRRPGPRHRDWRSRSGSGAPVTFAEGATADKRDYRVDFGKVSRRAARLPARSGRWPPASTSSPPTWSSCGLDGGRLRGTTLRAARADPGAARAAGVLDDHLVMRR